MSTNYRVALFPDSNGTDKLIHAHNLADYASGSPCYKHAKVTMQSFPTNNTLSTSSLCQLHVDQTNALNSTVLSKYDKSNDAACACIRACNDNTATEPKSPFTKTSSKPAKCDKNDHSNDSSRPVFKMPQCGLLYEKTSTSTKSSYTKSNYIALHNGTQDSHIPLPINQNSSTLNAIIPTMTSSFKHESLVSLNTSREECLQQIKCTSTNEEVQNSPKSNFQAIMGSYMYNADTNTPSKPLHEDTCPDDKSKQSENVNSITKPARKSSMTKRRKSGTVKTPKPRKPRAKAPNHSINGSAVNRLNSILESDGSTNSAKKSRKIRQTTTQSERNECNGSDNEAAYDVAVLSQNVELKVMSPKSVTKRVQAQEVFFGTSSQLATYETRLIAQELSRQHQTKERAYDDFVSKCAKNSNNQIQCSSNINSALLLFKSHKSLWQASARDFNDELLSIEGSVRDSRSVGQVRTDSRAWENDSFDEFIIYCHTNMECPLKSDNELEDSVNPSEDLKINLKRSRSLSESSSVSTLSISSIFSNASRTEMLIKTNPPSNYDCNKLSITESRTVSAEIVFDSEDESES